MRMWFAALGLIALGLVASTASAHAAGPPQQVGLVVIRDNPGESDFVNFFFPAGTSDASPQVASAAARAGLPDRGVEVRKEGSPSGTLELRLSTTIGTKTSFLSRRVDGFLFASLDAFHQGRVVLEVPGFVRITGGDLRPLSSDLLFHRYQVATPSDVTYRIPIWYFIRTGGLVALISIVPWLVMTRAIRRLKGVTLDDTEKVHRLRWAQMASSLVVPFLVLPLLFLSGAVLLPDVLLSGTAPSLTRHGGLIAGLGGLMFAAVYCLAFVPAYRVVLPYYRKLRGIRKRRLGAAKRLRFALLLLPLTLWLVFLLTAGSTVRSNPVLHALVLIGGLGLMLILTPLALLAALPTHEIEPSLRKRLMDLCRKQKVKVRDIRVIEARWAKAANALTVGVLPSFRYVMVTDYLLDEFQPDEIEAVVGHELGHAKQHHLLIKAGAMLAFLGLVSLIAALSHGGSGQSTSVIAIVLAPMVAFLAVLLVQGGVGLILERKADDFGSRAVSREAMIRALDKLADANMAKRRTGLVWNLLMQHPGVQQRVDRLRAGKEDRSAKERKSAGKNRAA